ncbi:MAG: hypothetical protein C0402_06320 [Thermodesulfovibrio sp.]|nr:hypothetical protein [Thermodesulfovibrio sp.]
MGNIEDRVPNFFGKIYPTYDQNLLIETLGIAESDKVLDIGGGHNPFLRADYIVDSDILDNSHRGGNAIPEDRRQKYLQADIHDLPFADKSIDFIYCSHVLEHVQDPAKACQELIRVGKRGFIETPRKWTEFVAGYPSHQWLVDLIDGTLVFERKQFVESPYLNVLIHNVWKNARLRDNALKHFLNVSCVQLHWTGSFSFRVMESPENRFDYTDPAHAALAHFFFAKNIFLLDAPLEHGIFHAKKAVSLEPDNGRFLILLAGYALALGDAGLWRDTNKILYAGNILHPADRLLILAGFTQPVMKKLRAAIEKNG